jgi:hypothetical protein
MDLQVFWNGEGTPVGVGTGAVEGMLYGEGTPVGVGTGALEGTLCGSQH